MKSKNIDNCRINNHVKTSKNSMFNVGIEIFKSPIINHKQSKLTRPGKENVNLTNLLRRKCKT
jgi:hypothetical protein